MRKFDVAEYQSLREEIKIHIEMAYRQSYTIISMVLVYLVAVLAFFSELYNLIVSQDLLISMLLFCIIIALFGFPTLLAKPFAKNYHDNIRAILSISIYCKIFHEWIVLDDCSLDAKGWELNHSNHELSHRIVPIHNLVSIIGIFFYITSGSCLLYSLFEFYGVNSWIWVGAVIFIAYAAFLVCTSISTSRLVGRKIQAKYVEIFLNEYIKKAIVYYGMTELQGEKLKEFLHKDSDPTITKKRS